MFQTFFAIFSKTISLLTGIVITIAGVFHISPAEKRNESPETPNYSKEMLISERVELFPYAAPAVTTENEEISQPEEENLETGATPVQGIAPEKTTDELLVETKHLIAELISRINRTDTVSEPLFNPDELNQLIRPAVVNIFCTARASAAVEPISGSGVLVDSRGIVLTNAHVAQYFLLDNGDSGLVSCVVRSAGAHSTAYYAKLLYISPRWVNQNIGIITGKETSGTGEHDYAFLILTEPLDKNLVRPEEFPAVLQELSAQETEKEIYVLLASYPAELLGGINVNRELSLLSSVGEITDFLTFDQVPSGNLDAVEVEGNILSQRGSSGGALVSLRTGRLIGIISVSSDGETTGARILRAITPHHISRSLMEETEEDIPTLFSGNVFEKTDQFEEKIGSNLRKNLLDEIYGGNDAL